MRRVVSWLIGLYQRHLSPRKGWRCAHAALHGGPSCSVRIRELVEADGVLRALGGARRRFAECAAACRELRAIAAVAEEPLDDPDLAAGDEQGAADSKRRGSPRQRAQQCLDGTPGLAACDAACCAADFGDVGCCPFG